MVGIICPPTACNRIITDLPKSVPSCSDSPVEASSSWRVIGNLHIYEEHWWNRFFKHSFEKPKFRNCLLSKCRVVLIHGANLGSYNTRLPETNTCGYIRSVNSNLRWYTLDWSQFHSNLHLNLFDNFSVLGFISQC